MALLLQRLNLGGELSPSAATIGEKHFRALSAQKNWIKLQGHGPAVLLQHQQEELSGSHNESSVICYLTPHLQAMVKEAAVGLERPLRLVNSERHAWLQTSGDSKAPDMFIAHPAVHELVKTEGDKDYDGSNFLFGKPGGWDLRDIMEVPIIEAKRAIGPQDFEGLGEVINYVSCLCAFKGEDAPVDKERILSTKCMLIASNGFWLIKFEASIPIHCLYGTWVDAGSRQAIVDFIQYMKPDIDRLWENAIDNLVDQFEVTLAEPEYQKKPSCFLGRGADGRVFRVCDSNGQEYAMKCVASKDRFSRVREEWFAYDKVQKRLDLSNSAAKLCKSYFDEGNKFAGLLYQPVGEPLPKTKYAMKSAIEGLKLLCAAGVRHDDTRLPNVIWVEKKAFWIDFRSAFPTDSKLQGQESFVQSVMVLAESCHVGIDVAGPKFREAASTYYVNGDFNVISEYLKPYWARSKRTEAPAQ
jgi:hypothetical protein